MGHYDAVQRRGPDQASGTPSKSLTLAGLNVEPGTRASFAATVDASKGLTIIAVWRARQGGNYFGADGQPVLAGTRSAGNQGWSWGHSTAIGGGATGNLVPQTITFQGIAQYTEANATIEAFVDTPVACRYDPATGLISWFRFGVKSSPDTVAGVPSNGGTLVVGAQGDFANNYAPWLDRYSSLLVLETALSDAEIHRLSFSAQAPNQVFQAVEEDDYSVVASDTALAGSAGAAVVAAGALSTSIHLSGAAAASSTATASLSTAVRLAGAAVASSAAAGSLTTAILLLGQASASASATGAMSTAITLTGAAAAAATASGALTTQGAGLSGSATAAASAAGALSTGIRLAGSAVATASGNGALTAAGAGLAGAATSSATASGSLTTGIALSGAASASATATGALASPGATLAGAALAGASATGALTTGIRLASAAGAAAFAAGQLTTAIRLAGAASASASGTGLLVMGVIYARAPAGAGYTPQQREQAARPNQADSMRSPDIQRNYR